MRYRMLDPNGDYSFGKGQQHFTYGIYAVRQAIQTRLQLFKGEWWEDVENGLPLFQDILGTPTSLDNKVIVDSLITERILGTEKVHSIKEFESRFEGREYFFYCKVITEYGVLDFSENL